MDTRREIQEFLTSRRARISPQAAGLGGHRARRVPGLRREEVATLAGLSVETTTAWNAAIWVVRPTAS